MSTCDNYTINKNFSGLLYSAIIISNCLIVIIVIVMSVPHTVLNSHAFSKR